MTTVKDLKIMPRMSSASTFLGISSNEHSMLTMLRDEIHANPKNTEERGLEQRRPACMATASTSSAT